MTPDEILVINHFIPRHNSVKLLFSYYLPTDNFHFW